MEEWSTHSFVNANLYNRKPFSHPLFSFVQNGKWQNQKSSNLERHEQDGKTWFSQSNIIQKLIQILGGTLS